MGQKSSCLAHKQSASGTQAVGNHRPTENGTAQDLLKDIARRSKLQTRRMSAESPDGGAGTSNSKHASENGTAVEGNGSIKRLKTTSTEDVDTETLFAPPVTQEVVKPHVHEIRHEEIHRDIHVHTNHRMIQPVYDLEALPPRHFVPDENGNLVEVNESDLPECTGPNARWHIAAGPAPANINRQQAPGNTVAASTGSDISSESEHDSDSLSSTDSVVEEDRRNPQNEGAVRCHSIPPRDPRSDL
ncbi:hypothetical protein B0T21DRAFT_411500 [Apiosordaria backusii]|uniref:Uncharacterized protein n=1 Tax=Apiosordaria backusii TaxID=314023 RepID=A0AA40BL89_9PEZI|nr:hypothetical protein B0T21DRAFT_411500 [Apiosordaria backusii]